MRVNIGPYTEWFGPYQLAEKILFWMDKNRDERVHKFGQWLAGDSDWKIRGDREDDDEVLREPEKKSLIYKFLLWVDSKKSRTIKIRIDKYDTWNMDRTLALIVLPMLKQLQEKKHGSQIVDVEDVPEHLRCTTTEDYDSQLTFEFYQEHEVKEGEADIHARWDWVLNEMIWAFEQHQPDVDWEKQYYTGESDWRWKKVEGTYPNPVTGKEEGLTQMVEGPNHTQKVDWDGLKKHQERISNGFRLFGKYYQGLWD
jgi:hypothetical protein